MALQPGTGLLWGMLEKPLLTEDGKPEGTFLRVLAFDPAKGEWTGEGFKFALAEGATHGLHASPVAVLRRRGRARARSGAARELSISQSAVTEAILRSWRATSACCPVRAAPRAGWPSPTRATSSCAMRRDPGRCRSDRPRAHPQAFRGGGRGREGRLHLGVTSLVAGYVLSDLLARYRRAFPRSRSRRSRTTATISSTC
jgi:hypothetical protein